jgi:thiamine biosynthesis lipoprotein ApbE
MAADALASAVSVLGPKEGVQLIENTPGTATFIVRAPAGEVETYQSCGWKEYPRVDP